MSEAKAWPSVFQELFSKQKGYLDEELDYRKQALDQAHKVRTVVDICLLIHPSEHLRDYVARLKTFWWHQDSVRSLSASLSSEDMLLLLQQILLGCKQKRTHGYKSVGTLKTRKYIILVMDQLN